MINKYRYIEAKVVINDFINIKNKNNKIKLERMKFIQN